jgi:hypothetical protein
LGAGDTVHLAPSTAVDPITGASVNTTTAQERTARDDGIIFMPVLGYVMVTDMTDKDAETGAVSRLTDVFSESQYQKLSVVSGDAIYVHTTLRSGARQSVGRKPDPRHHW